MLKKIFIDKREITVFVTMLLFLTTLPISYGLNSVSAIIIGALFVLDCPNRIKLKLNKLRGNKLFLGFLIYFLIQVIGLLYTQNVKSGLKEIVQLLPLVSIPITLLSEQVSSEKIMKMLGWFQYYLTIIVFGLLTYQVLTYGNLLGFEHEMFLKLKISTFYFSAFLFVAIITALFKLRENNFKWGLEYILIIFFSFVLLLLSARVSILILFLFLTIFLFDTFPTIHFLKKIVVFTAFSASFFFAAYQVPQVKKKVDISIKTMDFDFKTILTKNQISNTRNSLEYRVLINYCSFNILKKHIFGVGIGDNRDKLLEEYQNINFRAGIKERFNCHNQYMEEFTKQGVLGGSFFILLILYLLAKGFKTKGYFFYTVLYVSLVCIVESYFYRQHGVMFAAFFIPLFYAFEKLNEAK
jgi:hypothetical protein